MRRSNREYRGAGCGLVVDQRSPADFATDAEANAEVELRDTQPRCCPCDAMLRPELVQRRDRSRRREDQAEEFEHLYGLRPSAVQWHTLADNRQHQRGSLRRGPPRRNTWTFPLQIEP